jgi:hypothetical protein|tara:strand:+ start:1327 stop:2004 length:678 start_codon:yes stop_codon:yes gene_type:complete
MELSDRTLNVLKNFANINSNIVFREGNVLKTISVAKNILAKVTLDETIDAEFGIYDLNEFLSVMGLVEKPTLSFKDKHVIVSDSTGLRGNRYFYSDIDMLSAPTKDVVMPEPEVKFTLDTDTLSRLKRASAVLGHDNISITNDGKGIKLTVVDNDDATSNSFFCYVEGEFEEGVDFNFIMNVNNLKIVNEDFDVGISSKLISNFVSKQSPIEYFIALEKSSTYGK